MVDFIVKNYKLLLAVLFVVLIGICMGLFKANKHLKQENNRLEGNQTALMSDIEEFKTKSGKDAVRIRELELTKDEFKKLCDEQKQAIDDLGLKVKRLQYLNSIGKTTEAGGKTVLRDTVIITRVDSIYIKEDAKHFAWQDPWNRIEGVIRGNEVDCRYYGNDTVMIAATRHPKKFLFFKFGTKYIEVSAVNSNPSSKITYSKAIKIVK